MFSIILMYINFLIVKEEDIGWEYIEEVLLVDVYVRIMLVEEGGGRSLIGRSKEYIKFVDSWGIEV